MLCGFVIGVATKSFADHLRATAVLLLPEPIKLGSHFGRERD
jgi:hypothetical protein